MNMKYLLACSVAAVSIGTAMADPKPTVFPHGIAGSSNVMTSAGAVQGTLSDTVAKAQGSVQQATGNQPNGYAKPDASGNVTLPVTGSVAAAPADASGDTVSTIAATAKSGSAMAATAVQKSQVGAANGVAGLDANAMMSAPVSGDVSGATATSSSAGSVARTMAARLSDDINPKEYGFVGNGSASDETVLNSVFASNPDASGIHLKGSTWWPGNNSSWLPTVPADKDHVFIIDGMIINPTMLKDSVSGGDSINTGDGITSISHGTNFDGAGFRISRSNQTFDPSGVPMVWLDQTNDGPSTNTQGSETLRVFTTTTHNSTGYADGIKNYFYSGGMNYAGSFDVGQWNRVQTYGTNWAWIFDNEMSNAVPFYCTDDSTTDRNFCPQYDGMEHDLNMIGPEKPESHWDPSRASRRLFGSGSGGIGALGIDGGTHVAWHANTSYRIYQIIYRMNPTTNKPFMYYALPNTWVQGSPTDHHSDVSGATEPTWTFGTGDKIADGNLIWTCIGPFTNEVGTVLQFSGGNDPTNGFVSQFGTLLETDTMWCYNALIDFSTAQFNPANPYFVNMRVKPDTWFDLTAQATQATQNLHLLGYASADGAYEYKVNGTTVQKVTDDGTLYTNSSATIGSTNTGGSVAANIGSQVASGAADLNFYSNGNTTAAARIRSNGGYLSITGQPIITDNSLRVGSSLATVDDVTVGRSLYLGQMTKAAILALPSPQEGQKAFDTDDHEEVTYRCPTTTTCGWFPVQYGTALSN